jgi:hypothetical protein
MNYFFSKRDDKNISKQNKNTKEDKPTKLIVK